jgi:hypothetical protein
MGGVANGDGDINLRATLYEGWYGHPTNPGSFNDAEQAEIHLVVVDHGPSSGDPSQVLGWFQGCNPDCRWLQAAAFFLT